MLADVITLTVFAVIGWSHNVTYLNANRVTLCRSKSIRWRRIYLISMLIPGLAFFELSSKWVGKSISVSIITLLFLWRWPKMIRGIRRLWGADARVTDSSEDGRQGWATGHRKRPFRRPLQQCIDITPQEDMTHD